jgi:hypothetical protein
MIKTIWKVPVTLTASDCEMLTAALNRPDIQIPQAVTLLSSTLGLANKLGRLPGTYELLHHTYVLL